MRVDLNADLGEGAGADAALCTVITSANICCGLHAGSAQETARVMRIAAARGVGLGAHPGFDDRAHFGRTRIALDETAITDLIAYQTGAAMALARANGLELRHFKLHGALANMAAENAALAEACFRAALQVAPDLRLMVPAATAQQAAAKTLDAPWAGEIYADRAYNPDATLVDRAKPGAVIEEAATAAARILEMLRARAIIATNGHRTPARIDTICLHGDSLDALKMARSLRAHLEAAGVVLARF